MKKGIKTVRPPRIFLKSGEPETRETRNQGKPETRGNQKLWEILAIRTTR
jgi:hypothetical protein